MLGTALDWICWIAALAAIASYVAALLRNRPYLRPMNSLGLLLVGGALLGMPTLIGHPLPVQHQTIAVSIVTLLVASVIVQIISAFRRRQPRGAGTAAAKPAKAVKS